MRKLFVGAIVLTMLLIACGDPGTAPDSANSSSSAQSSATPQPPVVTTHYPTTVTPVVEPVAAEEL